MELLFWSLVFVVSLAVLLKSADYFLASCERIGLAIGLPKFIIGVTLVAIGTSLPELVTGLASILHNQSNILFSNVIGSNIANVFLVLGVAAFIGKKLKMGYDLTKVDLPVFIASAGLLWIISIDRVVTLNESIFLVIMMMAYLRYVSLAHRDTADGSSVMKKFDLVILPVSAIVVWFSADYLIEAVIEISKILHITSSLIAMTAIAIGTSLPELIVSFIAAQKKRFDIALGNVLGSNIFNSLAVVGIPGLIGSIKVSSIDVGIGLPFMLLATIIYTFLAYDLEIAENEGIFLILCYGLFLSTLIL
ncbi:MAG: sodium:calcium antiporter [Candidatus Iainarchaeum archaeon]|uniref:Sodium:calcium antiporter n=1 Tax=Candidatus Iainarchaeum sp. TaxID=3101447 RepID=A0A497JIK7_9ARCH|nr:MAG: sodium:calcium antiporter [Candidatus Diapherotrites archaeon]